MAAWLNKKNLEEWLHTPVKEIEMQDSTAEGENHLSNLKKFKVISESKQEYHLVVKCTLRGSGTTAELFGNTDIYKKEKHMYGTTLDILHNLLRKALPDSFDGFAPKCYYACDEFIVLEDLSPAGFRTADRKVGLDLEQSLQAMRTLARYHAASVVLHEQDPAAFDAYEMPICSEPCLQKPFAKFLRGMANTLADELETWPEEWHKYAKYLRNMAGNMQDIAKKLTKRSDSDFNVLIHGDMWTNNIMLQDKTAAVRLVDFQLVNYSSPAIDITYFVTTSAMLDVRVNHMARIIQEYHNTLCDTLTALGYKKKLITLEELQQLLDNKALYGVHTITMPYVVMQMGADCGFSFDECLATGSNPGTCMYSKNYKNAIKFLLPFYESKGAFDHYM